MRYPEFQSSPENIHPTKEQLEVLYSVLSINPRSYIYEDAPQLESMPSDLDIRFGGDSTKLIVSSEQLNLMAKVFLFKEQAEYITTQYIRIQEDFPEIFYFSKLEKFSTESSLPISLRIRAPIETGVIVKFQQVIGQLGRAVIFKYNTELGTPSKDLLRGNCLREFLLNHFAKKENFLAFYNILSLREAYISDQELFFHDPINDNHRSLCGVLKMDPLNF